MTPEPKIVFVYGTLRRGGSDHFRMAAAKFVGEATVSGRLYRVHWYPGLVLDEAGDDIHGDVYEMEPSTLAILDVFEGLSPGGVDGTEYRRLKAEVVLEDGRKVDAWVWEWIGATDEIKRLVDGDWLKPE